MDSTDLDTLRLHMVNEHLRLENAHDFDGAVAVFGTAKYEVVANGESYDGPARVNVFLAENKTAFPDFVFTPTKVAPSTDAVLVASAETSRPSLRCRHVEAPI
jgi:hypothetical protein